MPVEKNSFIQNMRIINAMKQNAKDKMPVAKMLVYKMYVIKML
jgi:hypothetical protein